MTITSRMPRAEYDAITALNISKLKAIKRSPQHFRHELDHPKASVPLVVGNAAHVAVLEPERYVSDFAVWMRRTEAGKQAPRSGQWWDAFRIENEGKMVLTCDENALAQEIAKAVRFDERANTYLASGDPEVTLEWNLPPELGSRPAKGRFDWLTTIDGRPYLVGLKTARDCRHFAFGSQAAKLDYASQWAYYYDGYYSITGVKPLVREIVVESAPPYAVAVYRIEDDIILQGRENYWEMAKQLAECEARDEWPGPEPVEQELTLPSWYYGTAEDDLSGLDLETEK